MKQITMLNRWRRSVVCSVLTLLISIYATEALACTCVL